MIWFGTFYNVSDSEQICGLVILSFLEISGLQSCAYAAEGDKQYTSAKVTMHNAQILSGLPLVAQTSGQNSDQSVAE
jgi:hypothetical protein